MAVRSIVLYYKSTSVIDAQGELSTAGRCHALRRDAPSRELSQVVTTFVAQMKTLLQHRVAFARELPQGMDLHTMTSIFDPDAAHSYSPSM